MCGLTGFWDPNGDKSASEEILHTMTDALRHRGPDDSGYHLDPELGLGLGHRRLSILDLTREGHQPMASGAGRLIIVYNGEIYNYRQLATELNAHSFRGCSDTEVVLAAVLEWGLEAALQRINGMFAFALYDRRSSQLHLVRDRAGIKPLYYCQHRNVLVFGSELKSLLAHPATPRQIDVHALHHYLRLGYVAGPGTIFNGPQKLQPGHLISFEIKAGHLSTTGQRSYWRLDQVVSTAKATPHGGDEQTNLAGFRQELDRAVTQRLVADVPLGAFLSGGIDSTLVVATMQRAMAGRVKTFSIGFKDTAYNEAHDAAKIAAHLGTEHHELYLEEKQLLDLIPRLPQIYCEPFGDSSQLATLLLAEFARKEVTVALTGDGGDELAAGYVRHQTAAQLIKMNQRLPAPLRRLMSRLLRMVPTTSWDQLYRIATYLLPKHYRARLPGDKLHKLARALRAHDLPSLYREIVSQDTAGSLFQEELRPQSFDDTYRWAMPDLELTAAEDFMIRDYYRYLPDDVLTKVDRATMAVGLEARVPLLDHQLLAYTWSLPESMKLRGGVGKYLLRATLAKQVPTALWDRPKMGFAVPVGAWLRGPLRCWCEDLLADVAKGSAPWFHLGRVLHLWQSHLRGQGNVTAQLWHLLSFLAWRRQYLA